MLKNDTFDYEKHPYCFVPIDKNDITHGAYIHIQRILQTIKKTQQSPSFKLLDYGCGAGAILQAIQKQYPQAELNGVDISNSAITLATRLNPQIIFSQLANKTNYPDNYFDIIIMQEVLEHVPEPQQTLEEIHRLLKPGGTYLLAVPQEKSLTTLQGWLIKLFKFKPSYQTAGHLHFWKENELVDLLQNNNLQPQSKTYSQHWLWQIIGVLYMLVLLATNNQTQKFSKELNKKPSLFNRSLTKAMNGLIGLTNIESILFKKNSHGLDIQFETKKALQ